MLENSDIEVWLDGGWGVDALLEKQTHLHKDLDLIVGIDEVDSLKKVLGRRGFKLVDGTPTSFTLRDSTGREIDIHVVKFDKKGNGIYRMQNDKDWIYPSEGFGVKEK